MVFSRWGYNASFTPDNGRAVKQKTQVWVSKLACEIQFPAVALILSALIDPPAFPTQSGYPVKGVRYQTQF